MARKLKVFRGLTFEDGEQVETIIATTSKKKVSELVGEHYHYVLSHWSETHNDLQIQIATSKPETVFKSSGMFKKDFKEYIK